MDTVGSAAQGERDRTPAPAGRVAAVRAAVAQEHLLVVLVLAVTTLLLAIGPQLFVVDSWLSLVSGREIVQHGLPHHEQLTSIASGRVWTDQQWLAHIVYYALWATGGLGLAVLFHAAMVGSGLALTVVAARVRGGSARMTLVAAVVCLFVAPWSWQLRAQSLALPLFAATLGLVSTDESLRKRRTLLVFPILVLWANVHGSVILGAALVSLAGVLTLARAAAGRATGSRPALRGFGYAAAPWLCMIVSPYGTDLVAYYRLLLFSSPVSRYVQEWKAPHPHGYLLVFFAVAVATVVIAVWKRRYLSSYDLLVLAVTLLGALRSGRGIIWFALAGAMLLPVAMDGFTRSASTGRVHRRVAAVLVAFAGTLLVVAAVAAVVRDDRWYEQRWPTAAARVVARESSALDDGVWPADRYADWLLWKQPDLRGRVAWDARFELLTVPEIRSIIGVKRQSRGWADTIAPYSVILLNRDDTPLTARRIQRDPRYTTRFADDSVVVVVRTR